MKRARRRGKSSRRRRIGRSRLDKLHSFGALSDADYETELASIREEMKKY
jgi:hypothetical protein